MSPANPPRIPYVKLALHNSALKEVILKSIAEVLEQGDFILGDKVKAFEETFAATCGVKHAIGVNSGTDALVLSLRAVGVGPGDEVITVPNSFVATASSIVTIGATPVFVDVREDYNIDPARAAAAITRRTKAILPVHLTGRPADMDPLLSLSREYNLPIIEDCAQAVLAEYRCRRVGSFGACGCFSMHPLKTWSACGDAGVITTNDDRIADVLRTLRNLGLADRGRCVQFSGNSRLDTLQAAVLLAKYPYVAEWTERRRKNAELYRERLSGLCQVVVPAEQPHETHVYHTFIPTFECRDELQRHLLSCGIETRIHYPIPIHLQSAALALGHARGSFPVTEFQADHILSLPIYPELGQAEIDLVCEQIRRFYGR